MTYIYQILAISGWVWLAVFGALLFAAETRRPRTARRNAVVKPDSWNEEDR
jgi:hypothetical protein